MDAVEQIELLRGVVAIAVADGMVTRAEKGVFEALARRIGITPETLEGMIEEAKAGRSVESNLLRRVLADPARAMELLAATAQIDGAISVEERALLVNIGLKLGVPPEKYGASFAAGVTTAQRLREQKRASGSK